MERLRRLVARSALQEHEVWERLAPGARRDGGVDVDRASVGRVRPDEGNLKGVVIDREVQERAARRRHVTSLFAGFAGVLSSRVAPPALLRQLPLECAAGSAGEDDLAARKATRMDR